MDLLKKIKKEDIDLLISDIELIEKGYELLYVIDPSDVFAYTFPYGIKFNLINQLTPDDIGDMLISYELIFRDYKPIILDEYKLELILNRNLIKTTADKRIHSNTLSLTMAENPHLKDDFSNSASFLLATSLLQEEFIKKFDDIYNNHLQIDHFELKNKCLKDEQIIFDIFINTKASNWSKELFTKWVGKQEHRNYNDYEVIKEYKSTLRDFIVLDRIIGINHKLCITNDLKNKYLVLYYSGAKKSLNFFKQKELIEKLPKIEKQNNYNLLRTPKHSFLLFLTFDKELTKMKEALLEFRDFIIRKENIDSKSANLQESNFFEKLNLKRRAWIGKSFIEAQIRHHKQFKEKINELIEYLNKNEENIDLKFKYESLLEDAKIANSKTEILNTNSAFLLQSSLIDLIQKLKNQESFEIYKGMDLIKGSYHHLPILIFFDNESIIPNIKLEKLYIDLVKYSISASIKKENNLKNLVEIIKDVYSEIENTGNYKEYYYEILIKIFILIFIEKAEEVKKEVADILLEAFENMKNDRKSFLKWGNDYLYTLIWIFRRVNNIKKSEEYSIKGIKEYPDDPRFYHGKVLCLYNKYFKNDSLVSCNESNLIEIIENSHIAIELYETLLKDTNRCRIEFRDFINGSISAINNLILYSVSLFYLENLEKENKIDQLKTFEIYSVNTLRTNLLEKINKVEFLYDNPLKSWPEYAHTESVLELIEAIYFKNPDKIKHSLNAINIALSAKPNSELYKKTKIKIENWRNKL